MRVTIIEQITVNFQEIIKEVVSKKVNFVIFLEPFSKHIVYKKKNFIVLIIYFKTDYNRNILVINKIDHN